MIIHLDTLLPTHL